MAIVLLLQDPAALVERLRSEDVEVRQQAASDLTALGEAAEPALDRASKDPDAEVAARATQLLHQSVAAYRVELRRQVRHIARHLTTSPPDSMALPAALKAIDPAHPWSGDLTPPGIASIERELRFSGGRAWKAVREKVAADVENAAYDKGCPDCVERRLATFRLGLKFENARVEDVVAYLRDLGDLRIAFGGGEFHLERAVTLEAKDIVLGEALKRVLLPFGLEARLTPPGVLLVEAAR